MLANYCFLFLAITYSKVLLGLGDVDSQAETVFQNYWEFTVSSEPEFATTVGDHRFNDKLNSYTLVHYENCRVKLNQLCSTAKELLKAAEPGSNTYTDLDVFIAQVQYKIDLLDIKNNVMPISYLDGPPITLLQLLDYVPMSSMTDFENLVARYNAFPRQVNEIIDLLKEGIRTKMTVHERSLKNIEGMIASFIDGTENSIFYEPFLKLPSFVPANELENSKKIAVKSINQSLNPALQKLSDFIQNEYRQHTRADIASTSLPNGEEFYRKILNFYVSAEVTAQEIHDMGLLEVERISKQMDALISSLGSNANIQQFNQLLRANTSMFFQTKEEALAAYTNLIRNRIEPQLPNFFKKLPKAKLQIKQVPEHLAGGPLAYYAPASPDGSIKGTFFLDTSNLSNLPKYQTVTMSLHEAEPGHHLQVSYVNEQEGVPLFRKRVQYPMNAAYLEGWALYSEYLGKEMNLYDDQYMLYGHLSESIFRACRLVVDTGIHALGWSKQQAVDYMYQNSASKLKNVQNEVDRYITWPAQACSYKFGEIKIKTARAKATLALGDKFDLKDFHDVVLRSIGPLSFVEKQVDRYISSA